ncbi:Predicted ATPase [Actinokineospora iranica]|uniref:Predicted ATPase n=2 Tax=Actinokineospora iranica TaxID=1271860 RepID=A0A1G6U955_9PSEU|nr:Predicted ATPase [Actinokineospora iranica]
MVEPLTEVTSYVGREGELAEAKRLLAANRLVTLTGVGGVGKTRLALRIADALRGDFPDGVALVELAELRDPELLAITVAHQLGLSDQSERPAVDVLLDYLRARRCLVVLDNCEHLVDVCARLVDTLVPACPHLTVLATSRQSLGVPGEQLLAVRPLSMPEEDGQTSVADLLRYESVRLFVDRARAVAPSFQLTEENSEDVARLCARLEGLPLAIELTAVRLRALGLRQIVERLTNRLDMLTGGNRLAPQRQQTLRAMIDWSYELCSAQERAVLARASVFSGAFSLEAVTEVCGGAGVDPVDVLDIVHALVDKSLLLTEEHAEAIEYRMLETVREYGHDQLVHAGDVERVRRLHRDWFADLTARYESGWMGGDQVAWVERIQRDHPNIRVALGFCATEPGEAVAGLRMANQLDVYWTVRGFLSEARIWLGRLGALAPSGSPERVLAQRLIAWCALLQGDIDSGVAALEVGRELAEQISDPVSTAYVDVGWALANLFTHRETLGREQLARAFAVFRAHRVPHGEGYAGFLHGLAAAVDGDVDEGRRLVRERVEAGEAAGEIFWRSWGLWALGMIELFYGDPMAAREAGLAAFGLHQELGNRAAEPFAVHLLGGVEVRLGHLERSATLFGIAAELWRSVGASPWRFGVFTEKFAEFGARSYEGLGEQEYKKNYRLGIEMPRDQAVRYVLGEPSGGAAPEQEPDNPLSRRESEIADLLAAGLTNREIAARLVITRRTVETHVDHILTKLGFHNRAQVAVWIATRRRQAEGN